MKRSSRCEDGVAIVAALIVMFLIAGVIAIFSMLAVGESRQGRTDRQRAESLAWVEAASAQLLAQLRAHEIGPHQLAGMAGQDQLWRVPGSGMRTITVQTPAGPTSGLFEVLTPIPGNASWANTVRYVRTPPAAGQPDRRGNVELLLRGRTSAQDPHPREVKVVFRRSSLAKYAVVSDAPIDFGTLGVAHVRGSIHSNNVEQDAAGIRIGGAKTSLARRISTTSGGIAGACKAKTCLPASGRAVNFTSVDHAFAEVTRLAARGHCPSSGAVLACVVNERLVWHPAGTAPVYQVELAGSCVNVGRSAYQLRVDAGFASIVDDRYAPAGSYGTIRSYCPSTGGMALAFNGDVQVRGRRPAGSPPVTIMARNTAFPQTFINGQTTTRQQPGSIYLVGPSVGAQDPLAPVGLIAEGSVYLPDWAIASGANDDMLVVNAAIAAKEGELSLGPMTMAMAGSLSGLAGGDGSSASEGGGLNPCASAASTFDRNARIEIRGAVASRRVPMLGYGTQKSCSFGFSQRRYQYADDLEWNPPPLYPTTSPWHVAEWDELAVTS